MKTVYVAGPFRGTNAWEVENNIRRAEDQAFNIITEFGCATLIPHCNGRFFDGTMTDEYWLASTMELLRRCDAIVLCKGWKRSSGSRDEAHEAQRLGLPIFDTEDLSWRDAFRKWVES